MKNKNIKIVPSLLSANFTTLGEDVKNCEKAGADMLHIDIMDGHFVPNITVGPIVVQHIRPLTELPLDCHLMINNPENFVEKFAEAGADCISVHVEGHVHLHRTMGMIDKLGLKVGVALNPVTPLEFVFDAAEWCDYILLMSVNPGFGGQQFLNSTLRRIEQLSQFLQKNNLDSIKIEVDGGINLNNISDVVNAGASIIVCGTSAFRGNIADNIAELRKASQTGLVGQEQ